jgi:hypothetical protein
MGFAQFTYRESLRDIEACLRSVSGKLYHMGFRSKVTRSTLADANESRDWRIFADFAQVLIAIARPLYAGDPVGVDLDASLYALDSTTIDLCLSLFPWARFRQHKAAIKLHTLLDLRGNIPTFIGITDGKVHDVKMLDEILPEAGAFYQRQTVPLAAEQEFVQVGGFANQGQVLLAHVPDPCALNQIEDQRVELAEAIRNAGEKVDNAIVALVLVQEVQLFRQSGCCAIQCWTSPCAWLKALHIGVPPSAVGSNQTGIRTVCSRMPPAPSSVFLTRWSIRAGMFPTSLIGTNSRPARGPLKARPTLFP